jgi:TrmH family RNA methyltransferase
MVMISKNKIKYITSLQYKKFRQKYNKFIIEGHKSILDIVNSDYKIEEIYTSNFEKFSSIESSHSIIEITNEEMKKISLLKTPSDSLAIVNIKETIKIIESNDDVILCLDDIQDPGNFGTIIRTANWFGIFNIVCSLNTVDLYNPKTLQSTMGAFANMNIYYIDLELYLQNNSKIIYGTFLEGENIYTSNLNKDCIIVMGNEGNGISEKIEKLITNKISIPNFAGDKLKAESLNVSVSTAVVLSEFKRK